MPTIILYVYIALLVISFTHLCWNSLKGYRPKESESGNAKFFYRLGVLGLVCTLSFGSYLILGQFIGVSAWGTYFEMLFSIPVIIICEVLLFLTTDFNKKSNATY